MNIKTNKKSRLLYILLACFLLFGFIFLPFQRLAVSADCVESGLLTYNSHYLYDIEMVKFYRTSPNHQTFSTMFPSSPSQFELDWLYNTNKGDYYSRSVVGYYDGEDNTGTKVSQSECDFLFATGGHLFPDIGLPYSPNSTISTITETPYYPSRVLIDFPRNFTPSQGGLTVNGIPYTVELTFRDFVVPLGNFLEQFNYSTKGLWIGAESSTTSRFNIIVTTKYRYLYNAIQTSNNSADAPNGTNVYRYSDFITTTESISSTEYSNGVAWFEIFNPTSYNNITDRVMDGHIIYNGAFAYKCVCDMSVMVAIEPLYPFDDYVDPAFIAVGNYTTESDNRTTIADIFSVFSADISSDVGGFDVGNFLASAVGGFLDFEIFPGFSLTGLLAVVIAIPLVLTLLKYFAGG